MFEHVGALRGVGPRIGNLIDEPKLYSGAGGKYESYSFKLAPSESKVMGDEYILVSYHTVKWGVRIGNMSFHKGDRVTLHGRYLESRKKDSRVNLAGSLAVNDKSIREVKGSGK